MDIRSAKWPANETFKFSDRLLEDPYWRHYDHVKDFNTYLLYCRDSGFIGHEDYLAFRADPSRFYQMSEAPFYLTPQIEFASIPIVGKTIRADSVVWNPKLDNFKMVIECDGYEYHKSKPSFKADRVRDRVLTSLRFKVLRYSGSEIFNNPFACAIDLLKHLNQTKLTEFAISYILKQIA
jgi:hypothetical protein